MTILAVAALLEKLSGEEKTAFGTELNGLSSTFPASNNQFFSENFILEIIFCIKFIQSFWWALGGLLIARESPEMTSLWGIDSLLAFLRSTTHKIEKPISFPCHRKHLHLQPTKKEKKFPAILWQQQLTESIVWHWNKTLRDVDTQCESSITTWHNSMHKCLLRYPSSFSNARKFPNPKKLIILFFSTKVFVSKFAC